jgi:hypothetical protein
MNARSSIFAASFFSVAILALVAVLDGDVSFKTKRAAPKPAVDSLVAIEVLLQPDETMRTRARAVHTLLRDGNPAMADAAAEFAPRISLARTFVRARQLDAVAAVISNVFADEQVTAMRLKALGYDFSAEDGAMGVGIMVERSPALARLHRRVLDALAPFAAPNGDASAFAGGTASAAAVSQVSEFFAKHSRDNFAPRVAVGVASVAGAERLRADGFKPFMFDVNGVAIYQLGDALAAARVLWSWAPHVAELTH